MTITDNYDDVPLVYVMGDYFSKTAPFGIGRKKSEFPDAISIRMIDEFCKKKSIKTYFIAFDNDFNGYESDLIEIISDVEKLIEGINEQLDPELSSKELIAKNQIKQHIDRVREDLASDVSIDVEIFIERFFDEKGVRINILDQQVERFDISEYEIVLLTDQSVGVRCAGEISVFLEIHLPKDSTNDEKYNYKKINDEFQLEWDGGLLVFKSNFSTTFYYTYIHPYILDDDSEVDFSDDPSLINPLIEKK